MAKYIFHMANNKKLEVEAKDLQEAMDKLGLDTKKPIGTRDGKPDSISHIEVETKKAS